MSKPSIACFGVGDMGQAIAARLLDAGYDVHVWSRSTDKAAALMEKGAQLSGSIDENGTLFGNLYIRGEGDPTLGSSEMDTVLPLSDLMDSWVEAIRTVGIKNINGDLILLVLNKSMEFGRNLKWLFP